MSTQTARRVAGFIALAMAVLTLSVAERSQEWLGSVFPGFLVIRNRVVASITLPGWLDVAPTELFQHAIDSVDGDPVHSASEIYAKVREYPEGTRLSYQLRAPDGEVRQLVVPTRTFHSRDYAFLFFAYLLNGVAFVATALVVFAAAPNYPASQALVAMGLTTGMWAITAVDLYGPHRFFPVHAASEAMLGATLLHLAVSFPVDRFPKHRAVALGALYAPFIAMAVWYLTALDLPAAYTTVHLAATGGIGVGAIGVVASLLAGFTHGSALARRRTIIVVLGSLIGFIAPGIAFLGSAAVGGSIPVNVAAFTAFLFPLSLGYAVLQRDLFGIDLVLRRAATYLVVILVLALTYFMVVALLGAFVLTEELARNPLGLAAANLALLMAAGPLERRLQRVVDHVFFRQTYEPQEELGDLSHRLALAYSIDDVRASTLDTLHRTLSPVSLRLTANEVGLRADNRASPRRSTDGITAWEVAACVGRNGIRGRFEAEEGAQLEGDAWKRDDWELLVPVMDDMVLLGVIVLGRKASGRAYSAQDRTFLNGLSGQVALALKTATAFEELRAAYERLEQSQHTLLRADRLATLGRLTAGFAHEVNTPLSAVRNSLHLLADLGRDYAAAIDRADTSPEEHRTAAAEIVATATNAERWAQKASAFVNRIRTHSRDSAQSQGSQIAVQAAVAEIEGLLSHRLRAVGVQIQCDADPADISVHGDPGRLSQILVNLVGNAVDAYEEAGSHEGRVHISARRDGDEVLVAIEDWAGGIPDHVLPHIFDELFTTKDAGRGTGLGLWITRDLVVNVLGGRLDVKTVAGVGTCFLVHLPVAAVEIRGRGNLGVGRNAA